MSDERTLPFSAEAERALLGALIVNPKAFDLLGNKIRSGHFFRHAHMQIYEGITTLRARGVEVDLLTLKEELLRRGQLDGCGGPVYIASLSDGVPRATNVQHYADVVVEKHTLRELICVGGKIMTDAYEGYDTAGNILQAADSALLDLSNNRAGGQVRPVRDDMHAYISEIEHRHAHKGELRGLDTGFVKLNDLTLGWRPGNLIIVAARPSAGKSVFVLNTGVHAAKAGKQVAIFSFEMTKEELHERMVGSLSGVPVKRLETGHLGQQEYPKMTEALETIHGMNLYIDDRADQTVEDVRAACRRMRAEHGLDLVVVDYLQLMPGSVKRKSTNRAEELGHISRRLKVLAQEMKIPVIAVSQLSRAIKGHEQKRPQLSDLRESGALEQDANLVAFIHGKSHKESGIKQFIVEKFRGGDCGCVLLHLDRDTVTFTDAPEAAEVEEDTPVPTTRKRRRT